MNGSNPILNLTHSAASFINFSNVVLCFILIALWGIVLSYSYQQSVAALMKKEQELFIVEKVAEQAEILRQLEMKERDNEIFHLRNVKLKQSNDEIWAQKTMIDKLVHEQEKTINLRTAELAHANKKLLNTNRKLLDLIQYNAHTLREPLTRILGGIIIVEYMSNEEFCQDIIPEISRAATDLDIRIRRVINVADKAISKYS